MSLILFITFFSYFNTIQGCHTDFFNLYNMDYGKSIVSSDLGADDCFAIAYMYPKIKAVLLEHGNTNSTEQANLNLASLLNQIDPNKCRKIDVFKGAEKSLLKTRTNFYYGETGIGSYNFIDQDYQRAQEQLSDIAGPVALYKMVNDHPGELSLFTFGPLTTVALTISLYGPEFLLKLRKICILGGSYDSFGNVMNLAASENNFYYDPDAIIIVMEAAASVGVHLIIMPVNVFYLTALPLEVRQEMGKIDSSFANFANVIESQSLIKQQQTTGFWTVGDLEGAYTFTNPYSTTFTCAYGTIVKCGEFKSKLILDGNKFTSNQENLIVITSYNLTLFKSVSFDFFKDPYSCECDNENVDGKYKLQDSSFNLQQSFQQTVDDLNVNTGPLETMKMSL